MESKTQRYQSRILREMNQNTENPFSPPSSTGSHGTVTLTSEISQIPEGESTRRMDDTDVKLPPHAGVQQGARPQPLSFNVNTSALGRAFPEWEERYPVKDMDIWERIEANENIPSPTSSTVGTPSAYTTDRYKISADSHVNTPKQKGHKVSGGSFRTLAEMQPTVESDHEPSMLSPLASRSQRVKNQATHTKRRQSPSPNAVKSSNARRGNVTALLETLKTAQSKDGSRESSVEPSPRQLSPKSQPATVATPNAAPTHEDRRSRMSTHMSPGTCNQTARSFFLPNLTHMNDFVSGALRWSTLKNGIPIFVKHGKVHDREVSTSADNHADVEALAIPEEEEKIFVSLDKIREEINELKEHDDMVSKQAEQLQEEIHELQVQLAKHKSRRDSAMGTDSESSMVEHLNTQKSHLEEQVATLKSRLDQANRKISINDIHTETYITERDEALKNATRYVGKVERLQSELNAARAQIGNTRDKNGLELEIKSLRSDNNSLRQQWKSLREENQSLRSHSSAVVEQNSELEQDLKEIQAQLESAREEFASLQEKYETVLEEKSVFQQDNASLERHNEKFYADNKALQKKNALLERQNHDLKDEVGRLQELLDAATSKTGPTSADVKEIRNRLENQNHELGEENAEYQQQIIDLEADLATQRLEFQRQRRQLVDKNEQQQSSLAQQLQGIAEKELTLAAQLKKTQVVHEARQITQEIKNLMSTTNRMKPTKTTRILDPKGKTTVSEMSARSTTSHTDTPMQDDYTQQIDLSQGSDFATGSKNEMPRPRTQLDLTDESILIEDGDTDEDGHYFPQHLVPKRKSSQPTASKGRSNANKLRPLGILKNGKLREQEDTSDSAPAMRRTRSDDAYLQKVTFNKKTESSKARTDKATKSAQQEQDLTGRFSVKSGLSGMSQDDMPHRPNSASGRFEVEDSHEVNMTSALFMDDITLESQKKVEKTEKGKGKGCQLTPGARGVYEHLDGEHKCNNCMVCTRINSYRREENGVSKKTVRIERPTPITDRDTNVASEEYEDQATLRPSQEPGLALAKVLKGLRDEEQHMMMSLAKKQAVYDECSPSMNKRLWKNLDAEMQRLRKRRDLKREQIYDLHDVLEGQKCNGQTMSAECVELTISSVLSRDPTWNGSMDC